MCRAIAAVRYLSLGLVILVCSTSPANAGGVSTVVAVESGRIRGEAVTAGTGAAAGTTVLAFRGIPFAAPPVGTRRWRPPQAVQGWSGVRDCVNLAPACPQSSSLTPNVVFKEQSEDCLYLNVWTAAKDDAERRPVMVWIHGGGNIQGGAGTPLYNGQHFAAAGVVLVSIQYRLGAFGYLAHPALSAEAKRLDGREASGNYGLMDQIAALEWVQANIGRFGGDPQRVTIFGESAGAANVTHLMASPLAKGLFHRAIAESGYFGENIQHLSRASGVRKVSAHQTGLDFAGRVGVSGEDAAALESLRALSVQKLLEVPMTIGLAVGASGRDQPFHLGPVVDGYVLPRSPAEVWAAGQMHRVPLIAGSLLDDGSVFSRLSPLKRVMGYRLTMATVFGLDAEQAMKLFPAQDDADVPKAVHRAITILAFRAPARRLVRWMEAAGGDAWLYHFSRKPAKGRALQDGVFHGLEIPFLFHTFTSFGDDADRALAADMQSRWINFARDGDPNGKPDAGRGVKPVWPKYRKADDQHLEFGVPVRVEAGLDREACDLVDRAAGRRR